MSNVKHGGQEFEIIEKCFRPLASSAAGAFDLTDDAAVFSVPSGKEVVVTKDAMVEGVHFLSDDNPANISRKLLRTNLSDIAAMGGRPFGYLLATSWNDNTTFEWVQFFAEGLALDQKKYGVSLLGGDTVKSSGPLTFSLTLMGYVPKGKALRRNGARAGDLICVSGTIGDGALGLKAALEELPKLSDRQRAWLDGRYRLPTPRNILGPRLLGKASACIDISDGLLADLGHICKQSKVGAEIQRSAIPLSDAAKALVETDESYWQDILAGGDDYELLFTLPPEKADEIQRLSNECGVPICQIGLLGEGEDIIVRDSAGQPMEFANRGWQHL
ncbi:thiamine-phosphate kinase [Sneathiella sp. P13V-1]|uniref:thiamine-phosphate kinase n=1 Tax=Sneathiella sp. P13V-1 TaxID=2697366 RepID=UPI00187BAD82|nr:thiamine-phosphate kinase [Sneathiella sp. P13V-1]MBE7636923.1 thiamine-phosphate kinase [Sneathiella sp. P13V-1]